MTNSPEQSEEMQERPSVILTRLRAPPAGLKSSYLAPSLLIHLSILLRKMWILYWLHDVTISRTAQIHFSAEHQPVLVITFDANEPVISAHALQRGATPFNFSSHVINARFF